MLLSDLEMKVGRKWFDRETLRVTRFVFSKQHETGLSFVCLSFLLPLLHPQ